MEKINHKDGHKGGVGVPVVGIKRSKLSAGRPQAPMIKSKHTSNLSHLDKR